jgi:hypothetical protein
MQQACIIEIAFRDDVKFSPRAICELRNFLLDLGKKMMSTEIKNAVDSV